MDDTRMFHFQQDYLGCVDDEANIVNKCDARRQVISDHFFSSWSLSRWLGRLMSIMMNMTTAVYAISVRTVFASKNTLCYNAFNKQRKVGSAVMRCLFGIAMLLLHICSWIRHVYPELYHRHPYQAEGETQEEGGQPEGQEELKVAPPSLASYRLPYTHV